MTADLCDRNVSIGPPEPYAAVKMPCVEPSLGMVSLSKFGHEVPRVMRVGCKKRRYTIETITYSYLP